MKITNYDEKRIKYSIKFTKQSKGKILCHKSIDLIKECKKIKVPGKLTEIEKIVAEKITLPFLQNMKFILFNNLEAGKHKDGDKLWIGSLDREYFELLFNGFNGKREIILNRKTNEVFIQYSFKDQPFLQEIPMSYDFQCDFEEDFIYVRHLRSRYYLLRFLLNIQTNNVHCEWSYRTEKSFEGNWIEVY
jgi:hypothetical protein